MQTLKISLLVFILSISISAQWYQQNSGTSAELLSVSFSDTNIGSAVGTLGTILRTTNGGILWNAQTSGTTNTLHWVDFYDSSLGYVVGNGGIILKTTNGGDDWFNLQSGTNYDIRAVSFPEENIGYIIYSKYVAKTINGGESWTVLKDFPGDLLYAMCFSDNSHGTILTIYQYGQTSKILRTNDGGNSWIEQNSGVYAYLFGVDFVDALNGIIVGMNGLTIRTTDGGYTWINRVSGTSKILEDVSYTETNSATAVGYEGTILHSSNGGNRWTNQVSNTGRRLMAVSFADSNNGTAVGENGTILHTTSGGITFLEVYEELPKEFSLSQNYPNPFNPVTKIKYSIPQSSKVVIKVFDILGNEIETLVNEEKPAGTYEITWFAEGLPSGIYFYQLKTGKYVETKKMLLMK